MEKVCCDIQIILLQRSTKNQKTKQKTTISSELLRNLYFLSNAYLMDRRTPVNKADVILVNTLRIPANFKDYVNLQIISTIPCNNQEPHIKLKMRFIFLNPRRGDVKYGGVWIVCGRQRTRAGIQFQAYFYRMRYHWQQDLFFTQHLYLNFTTADFCYPFSYSQICIVIHLSTPRDKLDIHLWYIQSYRYSVYIGYIFEWLKICWYS